MDRKSKQLIPIPANIEGFIFDLDGTLIDSMPIHYQAYNHSLEPWGIVYDFDLFLSRGGIPTQDTLKMIAKENNVPDLDIALALERKRVYLDELISDFELIQPVFDIVKAYQGKVPMAIGTGSHREVVDKIVANLGLDHFIDHVVTVSEVEHHKPHPETFLKCADLIGIAPDKCLVFEDGKPGIEAAKKANMLVVNVTLYL